MLQIGSMVNSPSTFKNYFKSFTGGVPGSLIALKSFYYGDTLRIIDGTRNDTAYPCLWMETPDTTETDTISVFNAALNIFWPCDKDDFEQQDQAVDDGFAIARDIMSRLKKDASGADKLFDFNRKTARRFVIAGWGSDYCFGCRLEFQLNFYDDFCFTPDKWTNG